MAPKTAPVAKKTYNEMISAAIAALKDRNGSSRQAIKKYIASTFPVGANFDTQFNLALSRGVKAGDFSQPKGSSGPVKLVKKEKKAAPKKPAAKKPVAKKPAAKKAAPKKAAAPKKPAAKKVTKKAAPAKPAAKKVTKKAAAPKKAAPKKAAPKKSKK